MNVLFVLLMNTQSSPLDHHSLTILLLHHHCRRPCIVLLRYSRMCLNTTHFPVPATPVIKNDFNLLLQDLMPIVVSCRVVRVRIDYYRYTSRRRRRRTTVIRWSYNSLKTNMTTTSITTTSMTTQDFPPLDGVIVVTR